jgi:hypothetical protein
LSAALPSSPQRYGGEKLGRQVSANISQINLDKIAVLD